VSTDDRHTLASVSNCGSADVVVHHDCRSVLRGSEQVGCAASSHQVKQQRGGPLQPAALLQKLLADASMPTVSRLLSYDVIGRGYTLVRRADPRLAKAIWEALGDARSVLNVGAGAGAYEPENREVTAVEPSAAMIAQRPATAAPVVQAGAEELPFPDNGFDAVMAILSDHHWRDRKQGLRELRRVARQRVVLFNADPAAAERFWLTTDYLPSFLGLIPERYRQPGFWAEELADWLGDVRLEPFAIPHDCLDGFYAAYWRRPTAYLRAEVRAGISIFARLKDADVDEALQALRYDLDTGAWHRRHRALLNYGELDLGYRVVLAEVG
jgi:SAM-dependent methyltransferase